MTGKSPRPGQSLSHRHSIRLRFPPNLTFRSEKAVELAQGHELPARIPRINLRPAATCRKSTIALIGSVFFPYYAWARRRGDSDPLNHAAPNVALYGETGKLWSMTERGRYALRRGASWLEIGRSALSWDGNNLTIRIDEVAGPFPTRIRGTVRLYPEAVAGRTASMPQESITGLRSPLGARLQRHVGAGLFADIELARPADFLLRIGDHLFPLGNPARSSSQGEQHREHGGRETQHFQGDA